MTLSPLKIIEYQLYLLQLENYNLRRFWHVFLKNGFSVRKMRQELVWTNKLKLMAVLVGVIALLIIIGLGSAVYLLTNSVLITVIDALINLYILSIIFGVLAIIAVIIISPLDFILKQKVTNAAKKKINKHKNLIIIGITGSYGKTTMKEVLSEVLTQKYKVLKTDENKNTPLGISRLILDELDDETEIFIAEMGAYNKGDIKKLCNIIKPGIAILTGINESHLERFGSMENTVDAKFEIIRYAKENAQVILNADDKRVMDNYEKYLDNRTVAFYSAENNNRCEYKIVNKQFLADGDGQQADILNSQQDIGNIKTSFLGEYIFGDIIASIIVARKFDLPIEKIRHGIARIKPIEHRLQKIIGTTGVTVIDDSYNGNSDGVREAIKVLAKFKNKRKIYITPGLVESGDKIKEIHYNIGKQLSEVVDKVILIKNSATPHIEQGLLENGFEKEDIIFFDSANQAHAEIKNITQAGDVVLFQNDWTDNYV